MYSSSLLSKTKNVWSNLVSFTKLVSFRGEDSLSIFSRSYADKKDDGCRRAIVDIPPEVDPLCPLPCEKIKKKQGILHRIKYHLIEGGTNFGTPFRRLQCKDGKKKGVPAVKEEKVYAPKALPAPKEKVVALPEPRAGVQVSVLGADTAIGQYVALLLKQCPCIKKLRLYESKVCDCNRDLNNVVQDLQHIDTNCRVQAFKSSCCELERCLQNTDIVLMLEGGYLNVDMPFEKRFYCQAPIVKQYADCIATECPKAFVIVCASPIDCMVPLVAETLKETGWYDPRKVMGSLAVPEMRASTLAARALCLEPRYTRVPCVGGTEGESLVPLFSKAVEYFDFATHNALLMTDAVRHAPLAVARSDGVCTKAADLSEAHALAGLVTDVAHALLCQYVPRVTGFVETDASQVISPARFMASPLELGGHGIHKNLGLQKMTDFEATLLDSSVNVLSAKLRYVHDWYCKVSSSSAKLDAAQYQFFTPRCYDRFDDCAYAFIYMAIEVLLNKNGICKKIDLPKLNPVELALMDVAFADMMYNVDLAEKWHRALMASEHEACCMGMRTNFVNQMHYDRLDNCATHMI